MFAQVQVQFLNKNYTPSKSTYTYFIKDYEFTSLSYESHVPEILNSEEASVISYNIYRFDTGNSYNGARVVIVGATFFNDIVPNDYEKSKFIKLHSPEKITLSLRDFSYNEKALVRLDEKIEEQRDLIMKDIYTASKSTNYWNSYPNESLQYVTGYDGSISARETIEDIVKEVIEKESKITQKKEKETTNMFDNIMKNFEMGVASDVKFSLYGPAFKNAEGRFIAHTADGQSYDVTGLTLDEFNKLNYMFPVAASEIKKGDFLRHNWEWVKVLNVKEDKTLSVIKLASNEEVVIHPIKNIFGFDFYTKLMTLGSQITGTPDEKNPFGNLLPLMLLSDNDSSMSKVIPFMMMSQKGEFKMDMSNPFLLMAMMK